MSLQVPLQSLPSVSIRSPWNRVGACLQIDLSSRPIGRLSQRAANSARSPVATITFLGEQQDISDPETALPRRTTDRQCSVRQQPVNDLSGDARQVTRWAVS
jgi:hypothetical protein